MSKQTSGSGGIGFVGLLTILFIALKLIGIIQWSWWMVLAPMWIIVLLWLGIALVLVLCGVIK